MDEKAKIQLEETERVNRAMEKIKQILTEENCKAEAVITFYGSERVGSEVQIIANPKVVEKPAEPVVEGGAN